MNLRPAVRFLRRRGLVIGAAALVGAGAAGIYVAAQPTLYRSTATTFVSSSEAASLADPTDQHLRDQVISSYAGVATTPFVLNGVIQALGTVAAVQLDRRRSSAAALPSSAA